MSSFVHIVFGELYQIMWKEGINSLDQSKKRLIFAFFFLEFYFENCKDDLDLASLLILLFTFRKQKWKKKVYGCKSKQYI